MAKYEVRVKFHKDFIAVKDGVIEVGVTANPEKGKANKEVLGKIARHFKVPISNVRIVSGRTSKRKIVEVES